MSEFKSLVDMQLQSLLEGIEQDATERRAVILDEARGHADNLLKSARHQARMRVTQAIAEERNHLDHSLRRANAALTSRQRRKQQILDRVQLDAGFEKLKEALCERWGNDETRQAWAGLLFTQAQKLLPPGDWVLEHPPGLSGEQLSLLLSLAPQQTAIATRVCEDIGVGLRLRRGCACLDMTLAGLLSQPDEVGAALLAEIHRQQECAS